MFFIMGINSRTKSIKEITLICEECGAYGRFNLISTYQEFSLFFIPLIKWGHQYYVVSTCCDSVYSIDTTIADEIRKGNRDSFSQADLRLHQKGKLRCPHCHARLDKLTPYCPHCGKAL